MKTLSSCLSLLLSALLSVQSQAGAPLPIPGAQSLFALTTDNRLLLVDAVVPQDVLSIRTITGLDVGDTIVGIDVRPLTGELFALSDGAGLYTINPATGAATKIAELSADPTDVTAPLYAGLTGVTFSIDFNPTVDRLRVVSDQEQNLRINPANGFVSADTSLAYVASDSNAGINPSLGGIAYTNNFSGALTTRLFGIDDQAFQVVLQDPPNNGALNSQAAFGLVNATHVGFDIAPNGIAYVGGKHAVPSTPVEYVLATLDPLTGGGDSHGTIGDGTIPIRDIAVAPTIAFSAARYALAEDGGSATITVTREGFINTAVSVQFSTFSQSAAAGSDYLTAAGTLNFLINQTNASFPIPVVNDTFPEADETVGLFLSNVSGPAVIGSPDVATLRINANDRTDKVGPRVLFIGLTGPSRAINGAVVHFNEDLDPITATNLNNYKLSAVTAAGVVVAIPFDSAIYDPVDRKVTLSLEAFMQTEFRKLALKVKGTLSGVTDLAGNRLDGDRDGLRGGNAVQLFKVFSGTTLNFTDRDGDLVTLVLSGGGQLDGIRPIGGPATQRTQFWILDPISLKTTLSSTVKRSPRGDGVVVIAEIIGLDKKEFLPISLNPGLIIQRLTFSPIATGTLR